jgi:anti-sigma-K factor RskA
MDNKEYISSGKLEAYLLGILPAQEQEEVENMLKNSDYVRNEYDSIEETLNTYINEYSVAPSEKLRDKILKAVSNIPEEKDIERTISSNTETISSVRNYTNWAIAATVAMLLSIGLNVFLGMKLHNAQLSSLIQLKNKEYADSLTEVALKNYGASLTDSMTAIHAEIIQKSADLAILKDPMYKMISLKGVNKSLNARALVCWCPGAKKLFIEVNNLPNPPDTMQYELWAVINGKPVNAGMIVNGKGLHKMNDIANASAFAVTLEKKGGSAVPHGEYYLMGWI